MLIGEPVTVSGIPPGPVPETETDPVNVPVVVGKNLARIVHVAPEARVPPQFGAPAGNTPDPVREKGVAPTVMSLIVKVPGPAFERRKSSVGAFAAVTGIVTFGNVVDVKAVSDTAGAEADPTNSTAPMSIPRPCGLRVPKKS